MSVLELAAGTLSLIPLALFFRYLIALMNGPSYTRKQREDFDPDTISGWHIRGDR